MTIRKVLSTRYLHDEWVLRGDDYEGLEWLSDSPKPSRKKLEGLISEVEAEELAEKQVRDEARASAVLKLQALGLTVDEVQAAFGLEA